MLSAISHSETDKYPMISLTVKYKEQMNKQNRKRLPMDTVNKLMVATEEGG